MSFKFNWQFFDVADLQARTQETVTASIAQTRRPPVIAAPIRAVAVDFGSQPPDLAFQAVPAVSLARTHIVFRLKYAGNASLTLDTAIEANPLREPVLDPNFPAFVQPGLISALDRLVLPFRLKVEHIVLDTLVDVVYTPHGVVVNFHDDPLKQVQVESSLDMLPGVNAMISSVLKEQLTATFYEDIPEAVWTSTSPTKTPPDPFRGARRWSQHLKTFVKFASAFLPGLGPVWRPRFAPFHTLALTAGSAHLRPPAAILNRGCLRQLRMARDAAPPVEPSHVEQFLLAPSVLSGGSETAYASSRATSVTSRSRVRPKRRVISLRGIMNKMDGSKHSQANEPTDAHKVGAHKGDSIKNGHKNGMGETRKVNSSLGDPRLGNPRTGDPRLGDPRMGDPRFGDPRMGDPRFGEPRLGEPRLGDPRLGEPRLGDPRLGDPRLGDPRMGDPGLGDPRLGDSRMGDPRLGDPRMGDPRNGHHWSSGDPAPKMDATKLDRPAHSQRLGDRRRSENSPAKTADSTVVSLPGSPYRGDRVPARAPLSRTPSVTSSMHTNGTRSNPQSNPQTPEFQSTESAVMEEPAYVPLPARWDKRRFSAPGDEPAQPAGTQLRVPKHRSTSMQPTKTAPLMRSPLQRSPARLPSTNDLMKVE